MSNIILVEEIQIDSMENRYHNAVTYKILGYVTEENYGKYVGHFIKGTGWPIPTEQVVPKYKLTKLEKL